MKNILNSMQWVIWSGVMALAFGLMTRARKKDLRTGNGGKLTAPLFVLVVGLLDFAFFTAIAIISNVFPNGTESAMTTFIFLFFSLLGCYLIYAWIQERHSYDEEKIAYTKFNGARVDLYWKDVHTVKYTPSLQWFVFTDVRGKKYYFATMLKGVRPFAELALRKLDREKIDSFTVMILRKIADGEVV